MGKRWMCMVVLADEDQYDAWDKLKGSVEGDRLIDLQELRKDADFKMFADKDVIIILTSKKMANCLDAKGTNTFGFRSTDSPLDGQKLRTCLDTMLERVFVLSIDGGEVESFFHDGVPPHNKLKKADGEVHDTFTNQVIEMIKTFPKR